MSNGQLHAAGGSRVVVAMSGGVDSSVAALVLKQAGYDAVGISMQVWDYRKNGGCASRATCCSPDDFTDARRVAGMIGIPYYVFDFEHTFMQRVIEPFLRTYESGETPNPCIDCNSKVKFRELRDRAYGFGCECVATGHYARIEKIGDRYRLLRGSDPAKDQSYFLYMLSEQELARTMFPVGELTKDQVREIAREAGLVTADKEESQDICFVSGRLKEFIERHGTSPRPGQIVSRGGQVLGSHSGVHEYTVGQRRGLRIGGSDKPLYVVELRAERNEVVVGERSDLENHTFDVRDVTWVSPDLIEAVSERDGTIKALAQLRHRHRGVPVTISLTAPGTVRVSFVDEWAVAAPGQAAVFYDLQNSALLGGGRIVRRSVEESKQVQPLAVGFE